MKKLRLITLLFAASAWCANAETAPYKLEVKDFNELKVTDGINVVYKCSNDSAGMAFFECEPDFTRKLIFTNNKSRLQIQVDLNGEKVDNLPTIRVYSTMLDKVENSGDSTVRVSVPVAVSEFKAKVIGNGTLIVNDIRAHKVDASISTGNGHIVINGVTRRAKLSNVGTGVLEAAGLKAEDVKCNVVGTGSIDCNASERLTVVGAGSGKVFYGGTPEKITNRSLGVKAVSVDTDTVVK